jgi:hypothetical protein
MRHRHAVAGQVRAGVRTRAAWILPASGAQLRMRVSVTHRSRHSAKWAASRPTKGETMRTQIALGVVLGMMAAAPGMARTSVQIGVGINVPPPVVSYHNEPRWIMAPHERVFVVDDDALGYDYFRYGGWYWIYDNDCWYRARYYRGPFVAVRAAIVPAPIWRLGDRDVYRWRHRPAGMPPGLAKKYRGGARDDEHGRDRGHGLGDRRH